MAVLPPPSMFIPSRVACAALMPYFTLLLARLPTMTWPVPLTLMPSPPLPCAVLRSIRLPEPGGAAGADGDALRRVGAGGVGHDDVAQREVTDLDAGSVRLTCVVRLDAVVRRLGDLDAAGVEPHVVAPDEVVVGVLEHDAAVAHGVRDVADQLVGVRPLDDDAGLALGEDVGLEPVAGGAEGHHDARVGGADDLVGTDDVVVGGLEDDREVARARDEVAFDDVGVGSLDAQALARAAHDAVVVDVGELRAGEQRDAATVAGDDVLANGVALSVLVGVDELDATQLVELEAHQRDDAERRAVAELDAGIEPLDVAVRDRHRVEARVEDAVGEPRAGDGVPVEVDGDAVGADHEAVAGTVGQVVGQPRALGQHLPAGDGSRHRSGRHGPRVRRRRGVDVRRRVDGPHREAVPSDGQAREIDG